MYVVQASPFSKIFMPEWTQRCLEFPQLIGASVWPEMPNDPEVKEWWGKAGTPIGFSVRVPRSAGAINLVHRKPVHASTLLPKTRTREVDEDEATPLVNWLTGGVDQRPCEETDIWGVVMIDVGGDFESSMQELMQLALEAGSAKDQAAVLARQAKIQKQVVSEMEDKLKKAEAKANERVKRALSVTHNNLIKSWETLKQNGQGTYAPSATESLGYFILKSEIDRKLELNKKIYNQVAEGIPGAQRI